MRIRRLLWLTCIALIVFGVLAAYYYLVYARPVGSGPAGPAVPREAFAKPWSTRKVLLLGLGDSVTAGFGVPPSQSYFARLAQNPPGEFGDIVGQYQ